MKFSLLISMRRFLKRMRKQYNKNNTFGLGSVTRWYRKYVQVKINHKINHKIVQNFRDRVCTVIASITEHDIIDTNIRVSEKTQINIGSMNPTACGTYGNAMLLIFPRIMDADQDGKCIENLKMFDGMDNTIKNIVIHDSDNILYVYQISTNSCDLDTKKRFPGHTFIIIKIKSNEYIFTQSYVDMYDHTNCIKKITLREILVLLDKFKYIENSRNIDKQFIDYWKDITDISIDPMLGRKKICNQYHDCSDYSDCGFGSYIFYLQINNKCQG
jgi:hypothetical protein